MRCNPFFDSSDHQAFFISLRSLKNMSFLSLVVNFDITDESTRAAFKSRGSGSKL